MNTFPLHALRVNVKSLASEARIIREEIQRVSDKDIKADLHCHRQRRVRPEARTAHLALAFVKGKSYRSAEAKARVAPVTKDIVRKLQRAWYPVDHDTDATIQKWLATQQERRR